MAVSIAGRTRSHKRELESTRFCLWASHQNCVGGFSIEANHDSPGMKVDSRSVEARSPKVDVDSRRVGVLQKRVSVRPQRVSVGSPSVAVDSKRVTVDSQRDKLVSKRVGVDSKRVNLALQSMRFVGKNATAATSSITTSATCGSNGFVSQKRRKERGNHCRVLASNPSVPLAPLMIQESPRRCYGAGGCGAAAPLLFLAKRWPIESSSASRPWPLPAIFAD